MNQGNHNAVLSQDASEPGGKPLPDLAYVRELFTALDALTGVDAPAANDSGTAADALGTVGEIAASTEPNASSEATSDEVTSNASECTNAQTQGTESAAMSESSNNSVVTLPGQCLLRDAVEMKGTLLACADSAELNIDVSAVERVDAAFMQLLIALVKQRAANAKSPPHYLGASAALHTAAQVLGLSTQLKLPEAAA